MGIKLFSSCCSESGISYPNSNLNNGAGNPDASRWEFIRAATTNNYVLVELCYLDCNNFDGKKILLFESNDFQSLMKSNNKIIDPHFSDSGNLQYPVARFIPTKEGWEMAIKLMKVLEKDV